ncbi:hypothetical protein RHMOL_Rhmol01G0016600 [Rhododendron molle]|uniref:Uncharacterized protein n=1 Tax=Rhododendron molle TaxID=49168 RepID=A0ACC0PX11_RHOML|nr:hypothetical protein RHMOL_Rhmol01G0016600 [Rhododendron molle]
MKDNNLVLIGDCFARLEELRISAGKKTTDDGVDALPSKLKELKMDCVKLRRISLSSSSNGTDQHRVTGDRIGFVTRHSPNLTSLSLKLWSPEHSAISCSTKTVLTDVKNLHSLTMSRESRSHFGRTYLFRRKSTSSVKEAQARWL